MTVFTETGQVFQATAINAPTGLVGTIGVQVVDADANVIIPRWDTPMVESPAGSSVYITSHTAPGTVGQYWLVWDTDNGEPVFATEALMVTLAPADGPITGPCQLWTTSEAVLEVYGDLVSDPPTPDELTPYVQAATETLYLASGRQFAGSCEQTVRPCRQGCGCWGDDLGILGNAWFWGYGSLGWGYGWGWWGNEGTSCGCGCDDRLVLNGYPVTEIAMITIGAEVVDPARYELQAERYVQGLWDPSTDPPTEFFWPTCQNLNLPLGQPGTWSVTYQFGSPPPAGGVLAAQEMAWQLWLAQHNPGECMLSSGVTKLVRQGITIDRLLPMFDPRGQRTGLVLTDSFLAAWNPNGLQRRPAVWTPDKQYSRRVP